MVQSLNLQGVLELYLQITFSSMRPNKLLYKCFQVFWNFCPNYKLPGFDAVDKVLHNTHTKKRSQGLSIVII